MRVLVADDHPIFLAGLRQLLEVYPGLECVAAVAGGRAAVEQALRLRPDVAVLDLDLPDLSGVEAARAITAEAPEVGVLMLTMLADDASVFAALRAGARGYLLKGATPEEVAAAIRSVGSGGAVFGPSLAARMVEFFTAARPGAPGPTDPRLTELGPTDPRLTDLGPTDPVLVLERGSAEVAERFPELTEREREILDHLADGETNPAIAARLHLSDKTVRNHVSSILAKLQVADRRQAMRRARDAGLGTR